jgi:NADH:ubiquinone reductase (H+-translocating)
MKKIIIIGGGFGGRASALRLAGSGLVFDGVVIDKKQGADFLPTLPDCIGRGITPACLSYRIEDICKNTGFAFINEEVISLDAEGGKVLTKNRALEYDYLIIASGSETNFYGNENIRDNAYKLDDCEDAEKIISALREAEFDNYIIAGGGYTGIEVSTNLRLFLNKAKRNGNVIIVERAPLVLGALPAWMREYALDNLKRLTVDVCTATAISRIEGRRVYLSDTRVFDNTMVIWAAGVKTSGFIQAFNTEKNPQGRIKVDEYLRLNERCFVAGDASYFFHKGIFLRMAVQFAIAQGECAAVNVIRSIKGIQLKKYRPIDFGYIIPMANNSSCGIISGMNLKGILPTVFHFMMCVYRSASWKNKFCLMKELYRSFRSKK